MELFIDTTNLPYEMLSKILYEHNGAEHNNSKIIKDYISNYFEKRKCFICERNDTSLVLCPLDYINHIKMKFIKTIILEKHEHSKIHLCFGCAH
jgi:hypothetical protein